MSAVDLIDVIRLLEKIITQNEQIILQLSPPRGKANSCSTYSKLSPYYYADSESEVVGILSEVIKAKKVLGEKSITSPTMASALRSRLPIPDDQPIGIRELLTEELLDKLGLEKNSPKKYSIL